MPRTLSLPLRLALLVAGTTLPLILFATGIVYLDYTRDREAAFERVLETARGMRLVLDREIQGVTSGLQVLALSQPLQRGDLQGFRKEVDAFLAQYPESVVISLADESGRQLINTRLPDGAALPRRGNMEAVERVFRTGRPAHSKAFTGSISGRLVVSVDVPAYRDGKIAYTLASTVALENVQAIIRQQRPNDLWTVAIFDQAGMNFARVPNPERTIGRGASPTLLAALFKQNEAKLITTSLEGVELITAFTRSPISGWTVAAGIPASSITAPLWRTLAITAGIGLVLLCVGLAFAVRMASRIARAEALHQLLINELNHRVKNTLATVQSIAAQTFRHAPDPVEAAAKFDARLVSLGRVHDVLSAEKWESAELREIVDEVIKPYASRDGNRLKASGPDVRIAPRCALMVSMALHELATNAAKYGALSRETGEILIEWTRIESTPPRIRVTWRESGGPPVKPPTRRGFGSRLIEHSFDAQLDGSAALDFAPGGVVCTLECALD